MALSTSKFLLFVTPRAQHGKNKVVCFPATVYLDPERGPYELLRSSPETERVQNKLKSNTSSSVLMTEMLFDKRDSEKPKTRGGCEAMAEWQDTVFPSCNVVHEFDLPNRVKMREENVGGKILGIGGKRIAWKVSTNNALEKELVVLKTIRWDHEYKEGLLEYKRRDAIATERVTFSPHVMNIYGHCSGAVFNEIGEIGADEFFVGKDLTPIEMLRYSRDAAVAIADVHSVGVGNRTILIHGDVRPWNYIMTNGGKNIRLHDFDQAHFLRWKPSTGAVCPFHNYACNRNRAPEECTRGSDQNEKIDVYALGNIMFYIIAQMKPYKNLKTTQEENYEMVRKAVIPPLPGKWSNSSDPAIVVLKKAMKRCYRLNPEERPSARDIANRLIKAYKKLNKDR
eukprot:CAMPEP_0172500398 /NCGR_PEP_ID=MMETSP1066-20121228/137641_1 /TAXON_ID=671091 /ORGANISM="Coscinodiscus wailesii, Strain CCMP2513" /LENGTH=396 /DNA_ID=CAMNT_0013274601 /DNA_START=185 /DNA_END=1375 /DNA_ORIENTATION=+